MDTRSSASSSGSRRKSTAKHPTKTPTCNCGLPTVIVTSWTDENPGRRFYGCPNYDPPNMGCKYFLWYDTESFGRRAKEVINSLKKEKMSWRMENKDLTKILETNVEYELESLSVEMVELKLKTESTVMKMEKKLKTVYMILVFSWLLLGYVWIAKV